MAERRPSVWAPFKGFSKQEDSSSEDVGQLSGLLATRSTQQVQAAVMNDGRVGVSSHLNEKAFKITKHMQKRAHLALPLGEHLTRNNRKYETSFESVLGKYLGIPRMNIAIHIVGSRGDVQPFIAIGKILREPPYGHRVRICTHPVFKDFVEENDLEFFSIGGDPATLMAYMVKNPGLMPGKESWKAGDVGKRRADIAEILEGTWRSCIEPGNGMGGERTCQNSEKAIEKADRLFVADAIIANPPSYGHVHCAEKLGIPLHLMFTMPWSPTQYFPHPLASIERNSSDPKLANYISYTLMELLAWQGLGDVINMFRMRTLHLDAISPLWGHALLERMRVPFTYAWSQALIPKPSDWGSHINITGFSFLKAGANYKPPADLVAFLEAGPPPVYIGFGSIVVDKPNELTSMIFGAVKKAGVRALVSKGWGGLGGDETPEGVFMLGNCPHDWLFQYVSCVVHHGGAGTTAIGIAMGKPTIVVPFFGDQPFWGAMIYRAGAGPEPVPYKKMTMDILASSIKRALEPDIKTSVQRMADSIAGENGSADAAASFHQSLNYNSMRCLLSPNRVAVWRVKKTSIRLSGLAAAVLCDEGILKLHNLKLVKHRDWYIDEGASNPIAGALATISSTITNTMLSFTSYTHNLHDHMHPSPTSTPLTPPTPRPDTNELGRIPSQHPLQVVVNYPPEHVEMIAYRMASKTLPKNRIDRTPTRTRARTLTFSSTTTNTTPHSPLATVASKESARASQASQHGKIHGVSSDTGSFALSVLGTGLKAPVAFFYNLANGFHNAPSFILHDETVRRRDNITGLGSGCKVAAKGFAYNLFDGVTGLVTHPYREAIKSHRSRDKHHHPKGTNTLIGFSKGLGKGIGALPLKTMAAVLGGPGYSMKGLEKQIAKRYDRELKATILSVRLRQGLAAFGKCEEEEKREILARWKEIVEGREF